MRDPQSLVRELSPLIGSEQGLPSVNYALKVAVRQMGAATVGAMHITCSDEAEHECAESFQSGFAQDLLPRLTFANRSPFRTTNLGGRYEWSSLTMTEQHFATPSSQRTFKLIVVKVNSHCAARSHRGEITFGHISRYDVDSPCCGLLAAMLAGDRVPADLSELMRSEGIDRIALLREHVDPALQSLAAALLMARLQARSAVLEAQDHAPATPTLYLVIPTVTLNKPDRDAEMVCGLYVIDRRRGQRRDLYVGIGDEPTHYDISVSHGHVRVRDEGLSEPREARDHRQLIAERIGEKPLEDLPKDPRIDEILSRARAHTGAERRVTHTLLQTLLILLAELSPVSAALLLFAEGAGGIYNAYRAHHIVGDVDSSAEARDMLLELHRNVDRLPPDEAERVLKVLLAQYGGHS